MCVGGGGVLLNPNPCLLHCGVTQVCGLHGTPTCFCDHQAQQRLHHRGGHTQHSTADVTRGLTDCCRAEHARTGARCACGCCSKQQLNIKPLPPRLPVASHKNKHARTVFLPPLVSCSPATLHAAAMSVVVYSVMEAGTAARGSSR